MPTREPNLLTTGQAAKLCSVTPDTILKWIKKGRLNGVRTAGGHYRIERRHLEPLALASNRAEIAPHHIPDYHPKNLRCWEYLSDGGAIRDDCQQCVVYRVRAARCFLMAALEPDVGHARRFCQTTCDDCVYYRRMNGLAVNVLVITSDDKLMDRLSTEQDESVALCFARNAYEASAIIHDFRPAFAVIDPGSVPDTDTELLGSLATDPRVPGLRIILVAASGRKGRRRPTPKSDLVVSVLEKPFGTSRIAAVINSLPVGSLSLEDAEP